MKIITRSFSTLLKDRSFVFSKKILPYIVQRTNEGHMSALLIERKTHTVDGLVVPELEKQYYQIISELEHCGFKTTVKIWEEGHIVPPFYNVFVEW